MIRKHRLSFLSIFLVIVLLLTFSVAIYASDGAKYVFMFIGDGMANAQITAAEAFKAHTAGKLGQDQLNFTKFPANGMQKTYANNRFITGSAAAATALACGVKTNIGYLGLNPNEQPVKSIATLAKEAGMKVGIVSSVTIDHATPAGYYAQVPDRGMYYEIGQFMADSGFDYFGGGMPRIDKTPEGKPSTFERMETAGYTVINADEDPEAFAELKSGPAFVYQGSFTSPAGPAFKYCIDSTEEDFSLADFTEKGIELLENPDGFFMMIESGKIDWAGHANDAVANIHDTLGLDKAVGKALEFYEKYPDETLIVVTGDHECGGLTIGWAGTEYESGFEVLTKQKHSYEFFDVNVIDPYREKTDLEEADLGDLKNDIEEYFGLTDWTERETEKLEKAFERTMKGEILPESAPPGQLEPYLEYGFFEPLSVTITHLVNQRAGLSWTSFSHTGVPVPVYAKGANSEIFNGFYENTDIFKKLVEATGLNLKEVASLN